jgi:Tfp pilus assembly protein PilP
MRRLTPIWTLCLALAASLVAVSAAAQTKQTPPPPAKKGTQAPVVKTAPPAPAPVKAAPAGKATAPAKAPAKQPAAKPAEGETASTAADKGSSEVLPGNRRDPFQVLVAGGRARGTQPVAQSCPRPGKESVTIDTMRMDGVVRSANGMIAVVRTPQQRVYFLRDGDRLCDGQVQRITMDGMTLRQSSKDAFGKVIERPVTKQLFPSAGEQR